MTESVTTNETDLPRSFLHGLLWTGGVKWIAQLISWPVMLLIARLLSPSDFGFIALVSVWTKLIMLVTEGGIGAAIVFGPSLAPRQLRELNVLALALSVMAFLLASALAPLVATFYHNGALALVMIAIASTFLLEGAMLIPVARLRRTLRFRELALADAARAITDSLVTLTVAYLGGRYWALVAGYGSGVVTVALISIALSPTGFALPRWSSLRETLRYASHLMLTAVTSFLYGSADYVIGGRLFGAGPMGAYSLAQTIAFAPSDKLVSVLTRVTPSVFGRLRSSPADIGDYLRKITRALAILILPVLAGIAAIAPTLIPLVLGPRWDAAVIPLQILCAYAATTSVTALVPQVLQAIGSARVVSQNALLALTIYPPAFWAFGRLWGVAGVATAWAVLAPVISARLVLRVCNETGMSPLKYLTGVVPAVISSALMFGCVYLTRLSLPRTLPLIIDLLIEIVVGVVVYGVAILASDGVGVRQMVKHLRPVTT